jgi:hypothetical protein
MVMVMEMEMEMEAETAVEKTETVMDRTGRAEKVTRELLF